MAIISLISDSLSVTNGYLPVVREEANSPFLYTGESTGLMYVTGRYGDLYREEVAGNRPFYINDFPIDVVVRLGDVDRLAITDGSLNVNVEKIATLAPTSLTITNGTLTLTRDRQRDLIADSLSVSDGTLGVRIDRNRDLISDTLNVSDGNLAVRIDRFRNLIADTMSVSNGSVTLTRDRQRDLIPESLTTTSGNLNVNVEKIATLTPESMSITDGSLNIRIDRNRDLIASNLTVSDGTLSLRQDRQRDLIADSLSVTGGQLTIVAKTNINVVLKNSAINLSNGTLPIDAFVTTFITLSPENMTITDGVLDAGTLFNIRLSQSNSSILKINSGTIDLDQASRIGFVSEEAFLNSGDLPPQYGAEFISRSPRRGAGASRITRSGANSTAI